MCKGYYCGHLGKPSGQLSGNPWMVVGHVPVVYSSPRSLRPHLLKDSSLSIYFVPQSCLCCPLSAKSLSHSNPSYSFLEGQLALKTRLFIYIYYSFYKFYDDPTETLRAPYKKPSHQGRKVPLTTRDPNYTNV